MSAEFVGLAGSVALTITDADLATAMGSGDVPVLATPAVLALCEAATVAAVHDRLQPGQTTVGAHVELDHVAPSRAGAEVEATATVTAVDRSRVTFSVEAREGSDLIARGTIVRYVVDRSRFE